jgi:hypothetical protein
VDLGERSGDILAAVRVTEETRHHEVDVVVVVSELPHELHERGRGRRRIAHQRLAHGAIGIVRERQRPRLGQRRVRRRDRAHGPGRVVSQCLHDLGRQP